MSDDVWILGIHMTKFGKHPDKDTVDLGSEAVFGALADAGEVLRGDQLGAPRITAQQDRRRALGNVLGAEPDVVQPVAHGADSTAAF